MPMRVWAGQPRPETPAPSVATPTITEIDIRTLNPVTVTAVPVPVAATMIGRGEYSNRTFGVEIEMTYCTMTRDRLAQLLTANGIPTSREEYNHQTRLHWKLISDATVNFGELVSPVLSGQDGRDQIRRVCATLNENDCRVDRSAGLHVHFGARDIAFEDIRRFAKNFVAVQDVIDLLIARSRRGNHSYARRNRLVNHYNSQQTVDNARNMGELANVVQDGRYAKLNLHAFSTHGTVEIRCHQGTTNAKKIVTWINFIDRLMTASFQGLEIPQDKYAPLLIASNENALRVLCFEIGCSDTLTRELVETARRVGSFARSRRVRS
jgi:hypothetical protein